jgi:hypothetical protein
MKLIIISVVFLFTGIFKASAQTETWHLYILEDGEKTSLALSEIRKLVFRDGKMELEKQAEGETLSFDLGNTLRMGFEYNSGLAVPPVEKEANRAWLNPDGNRLTVISEDGTGDVALYNLTGQLIRRQPLDGAITIMNLTALPGGIYLVKTNTGVEKIIK